MTSRRDFLKASSTAALAAALPANAHAGGNDLLKVALVGCGGRGTGAAAQALHADKNVKLVALADAFADRLDRSLKTLQGDGEIAAKVDVPPERRFVGFDAYKGAIEAADVVLLCEPPHFRPRHLRAAIEAGRHVFAEKPVAVDAPGVRSMFESCELARKKGLSIVSGLCLRYSDSFREAMKRIHDGAIGEVVALQANDYRSGRWSRARLPGQTDMEYQMRNWYNFAWLSGDFNVEQHVHFLDVASWAYKDVYPVKAVGMGGRQVLVEPEYGNIYDHFSVVYEYAGGVRLYSNTRHHRGCKNEMATHVFGSRGRAFISEGRITITGPEPWERRGRDNNFYQTEHDELFASIRNGKPINNGEYMTKSSLLAILGRMSAYTGQEIGWDQALASKEDLSPPKYDWSVPLETPPVAVPGRTKFV
jgi:predicted dehydrogenase